MNRIIIPESAQPATPADPAPVAIAMQQPASDPRDALAGALPAWDLLPASPFIRRVK
jgi:hypothetical protein